MSQVVDTLKLWAFAALKVPLILSTRPVVECFDDDKMILKIKLRRKTRNHLNSMYLGVLTIGAELAAGAFAFLLADKRNQKMSIVFKSMQADFLKRVEGDALFVCDQTDLIKESMEKTRQTGERVNCKVPVRVLLASQPEGEPVATFLMELSIKAK